MEILNRINDNINEVKQRLARLEGQDSKDVIRSMREDIEKERNARIDLQIELSKIKTKLAPVLITISLTGAAVIQLVIQSFK